MNASTQVGVDTRFRSALRRMQQAGRIRTFAREADPEFQIAGMMKKLDGGAALLFPRVKGHGMPVIGNVLCCRENCEAAFGMDYRGIRASVARAFGNPVAPVRVANAPVHEHVYRRGKDGAFDIGGLLPVLAHSEGDSGRFITAGIVVVQDPETGVYNASYHRLQLIGAQRTAVKLDFGRHLRAACERAQRMGRPLPIAVCIGTDLAVHYAAATMGSQMPESTDELAIAGGMRGEPVPVIKALTQEMLARSRFALKMPSLPAGRRIRVVDATDVEEPGATGTSWRVHYTLQLPSLSCDFFEVTDAQGGETYKRVPVRRGDIILGDRGYSHREGVAHVLKHHGDVVVRVNSTSFPLLTARGAPLLLLPTLRTLRGHTPKEWPVQFDAAGTRFPARLCAIRKSRAAAERAKKRALRESGKKNKQIRPETLEAAEYVFVLATMPAALLTAWQVLELYRVRWQVELAFKRMKSLLGVGHVPKYDPHSARAWIQAKLLTVLLIEQLITEARFFSPWGFHVTTAQPVA